MMHNDMERISDALRRMRDIHQLNPLTGHCLECHHPFPCDSYQYVAQATEAMHPRGWQDSEQDPAAELGNVLRALEYRLGLEGPRMEKLISRLHHLVLEPGVEVTGYADIHPEYCVAIASGDATTQPLWRILAGSPLVVEVFAPVARTATKRFLSALLSDTFSPRDAESIVGWWDDQEQVAERRLAIWTEDPTSMNTVINQLIDATLKFNDLARTVRYRD